ncbi:DUF2786 domain-containing protein [Aeromicrobium fastidiosum]|uniref:DUF2786 domain-containing protein n=1 Tax=Aeromicrobium fastidiosum TaxID=52699 RepID=A0A641AK04_9ACTN|nr:DUF2786 domain-containing protein [Aeromicrobium fastidiosum]KAA1376010.1 DUF2786 domain-containing protein [Aeromicrobium fastidiosum]MBP2392123.1 hypothetical protein [Aeromicrobium fastidiosum]
MSRESRQRREARRRAQRRTTRVTPQPSDDVASGLQQSEIIALIDRAVRFAVDAPRSVGPHVAVLNELGAVAESDSYDPAALVVDEALTRVAAAFEHGWQPLDLVHAARRQTSKPAAEWLARVVLIEASSSGAMVCAPQPWRDQLTALSSRHGQDDALLPLHGRATSQQWVAALVALDLLHRIPRLEALVPPPSRWGTNSPPRQASTAAAPAGGDRAKTLAKIRALLAKAESTDFAAEAEAFTAKAQDLMTRHSIDETLLAADAGSSFDVHGRRVLIDQPYALEKATLLHVVADANRVRTIWNSFAAHVTLVGLPTDVEQVDLLFTSTLVQATRAMTQADLSSAPFRRAFLHAFAVRIGERLTTSSEEAVASYGSSLVPVLERQAEAVTEEFERLFPHVLSGSRRSRQLDRRGWDAGTRAADAAVLPAGRLEA